MVAFNENKKDTDSPDYVLLVEGSKSDSVLVNGKDILLVAGSVKPEQSESNKSSVFFERLFQNRVVYNDKFWFQTDRQNLSHLSGCSVSDLCNEKNFELFNIFVKHLILKNIGSFPESKSVTSDFNGRIAGIIELYRWGDFKKIYNIDPDFYADFSKTEIIPCDFDIITRIPFPVFYLDLSSCFIPRTNHFANVKGILVDVITDDSVHIVIIDSDNNEYGKYFGDMQGIRFVDVCLERSISNKDIKTSEMFAELGLETKSCSVINSIDYHSSVFRQLITFAIQFLHFIASKTEDIISVNVKPNCRHHDLHNDDIQQWNVGVRYGEKIRTIKRKQSIYGDVHLEHSRNRPRPYVRAAHWHSYWCGSRENKQKELRWIEPTFCNGTVDDIIATINTVTDKEINGSSGEELIKMYLEKFNVNYEREFTVNIKNHNRRFDFRILHNGKIMFIEFDGEQHFMPIDRFGGIEEFKSRRNADFAKTKYARQNKIPLLRIRYDQIQEIPEIIDSFLEKPSIRQFNPKITNEQYYKF